METISPPATEDAPKRHHRVLDALTKHWLPFLTGLLALATAAVGLYAKQATSERDQLADDSASLEVEFERLSARNAELSDRNEELEAANDELREDNDRLRQRVEGAAGTDGPDDPATPISDPPSSGPPEVFRTTGGTPVVVPEYSGIDLDSQESNWGIESGSRDLYVVGGADQLNVSDTLAVVDAPPTVDECEAQTVRQEFLDRSQTVVGQHLCVRTGDGRWAYVRIAAMDMEALTMSFDITVWKLPSDP